jgi:uncharacterized protein YeaO (DUF488 family)
MSQMSARVHIDRVYAEPDPSGGERILVDRLWPRGFRKDDPRVGRWLPTVAPTNELRRWYAHEAARFAEFAVRYAAELESGDAASAFDELRGLVSSGPVTLVTSTRDLERSHTAVLADLLTAETR